MNRGETETWICDLTQAKDAVVVAETERQPPAAQSPPAAARRESVERCWVVAAVRAGRAVRAALFADRVLARQTGEADLVERGFDRRGRREARREVALGTRREGLEALDRVHVEFARERIDRPGVAHEILDGRVRPVDAV